MKYFAIIVILSVLGYLFYYKQGGMRVNNSGLPDDCIMVSDGCNTCFAEKGDLFGCTKLFCEKTNTPECVKYSEE